MPKTPSPIPPPDHPHQLTSQIGETCRFCWKRFTLKCGAHGLGWPLVVLGILLLWLRFVGIPQPVVKRVQAHMQTRGVLASVDHMYYGPLRGLSIRGLRIDVPASDVPLSFEVDDARILWNPLGLRTPSRGLKGLAVRSGKGRLDISRFSSSDDRIVEWTFDALNGRVELSDSGVRFVDVSGQTFGFDVQVEGDLVFGKNWNWEMPAGEGDSGTAAGLQPLVKALETLQSIQYQRPPRLGIDFLWNAQQPSLNEMQVEVKADDPLVLRGITFNRFALAGALQSNVIVVTEGILGHEQGDLALQGKFFTLEDELAARVSSSLPPQLIRELLPAEWTDPLWEGGLLAAVHLETTLDFPRNQRSRMLHEWSGKMSATGLNLRGLWVDSLSMNLERSQGQLRFTELDGQLGRGEDRGPLKGRVEINETNRAYSAKLETGFHPSVVLPICPPALAGLLERFSMNRQGPRCTMEFTGRAGVKDTLRYRGEIEADNFAYNGAHMGAVQTVATYSNRVLRLDPLVLIRSEGELNGAVQLDFQDRLADLKFVSFINPEVLATIIHPRVEEILRPFEFKGDSFLRLNGVYDYGKNVGHNLNGSMYVEQAGPDRLLFEDCYFQMSFVSNVFSLVDMKGTVENGPFTGFVQIDNLEVRTNRNFFLNFQLENADLEAIVERNFALEENPYNGFLSTHVSLDGKLGPQWPSTLVGKGGLSVRDGQLFRMPLLGGLSRYLSKMFRGFGYASQGDFNCTFLVKDEALKTKDAELQGSVLSATGHGTLGFDRSLDFKVQVRPLRDGVVAEVFRIVLSPITKLFEFKLGGNLSEPTWRPDNLPKELFLKFD